MVNNVHPLVTIAILTYNRADSYLRETLASAMNQTYQERRHRILTFHLSARETGDRVGCWQRPRLLGLREGINYCQI